MSRFLIKASHEPKKFENSNLIFLLFVGFSARLHL